jgi:hypothetical protein
MKSAFNESMYLSLVIYAQFMFTLVRAIMFFLATHIEWSVIVTTSSFLLSFDSMTTLGIYFLPKLAQVKQRRTIEASQRETVAQIRKRVQQKLGTSHRNVRREDLIITKPEALRKEVKLLKKDNISLREQNAELVKLLSVHQDGFTVFDLEKGSQRKFSASRLSISSKRDISSSLTDSTNTEKEFSDEVDLMNKLWDLEDTPMDEDDYEAQELVKSPSQELPLEEFDALNHLVNIKECPIEEEEYIEANGAPKESAQLNETLTTSASTVANDEKTTTGNMKDGPGEKSTTSREEVPHQRKECDQKFSLNIFDDAETGL